MKYFLSFAFLHFFYTSGLCQISIQSKITDANNNPLIGVSINILDTKEFTFTDLEGNFEITGNVSDSIEINYLGYYKSRIAFSAIPNNIILQEKNLDEVVIINKRYKHIENLNVISIPKNKIINPLSPERIYNSIPGIYMHAGAPNTNRVVIRGIGSRSPFSTTKIKAYLNDIPLTNGIGETNLEDINLNIIDEISITKGPSPSKYGAGLGGLIHYKTKANFRDYSQLSLASSYGAFNTFQNNISYKFGSDKSNINLQYNRLDSDGYRDNNVIDRTVFSAFGQFNLGADLLSVFVNHTELKGQIPSGLNIEDFNTTPEAAAGNWKGAEGFEDYKKTNIGISYQKQFKHNYTAQFTGYLGTFENYERRPFNVLTQQNNFKGIRLSVDKEDLIIPDLSFSIGTELYGENEHWSTYQTLDIGQGNILSDNKENRFTSNSFLNINYKKNNWVVDFGVNANTTNYQYDDWFNPDSLNLSGKYNYDPVFSPKLSIGKSFNGKIVYAKISHGMSAPTLEETLLPSGVINPEIKPETGWNTEIGFKNYYRTLKLDIDIVAYYMSISNLLVAERVTEDQFIGINAGKTTHPGVELSLKKWIELSEKNTLQLSVNYNFSPHKFSVFTNNEVVYDDKFLPGLPSHQLHSSIQFNNKHIAIVINNLYASKMYADDINSITVDGYNLTDLMIKYFAIKKSKVKLDLTAGLSNVFDIDYASMISVNPRSFGGASPRYLYSGLPRNLTFGVNLQFSFSEN